MIRVLCLFGLLGVFPPLALSADLPARLDWAQRLALSPSQAGVIEAVMVQPGQVIEAGTPLYRLEQTHAKARLMEARAEHDRASQDLADAQRELDRVNELYARTVSSTTELDSAKLRHARAHAQFGIAQARMESARRLLDETEPRAPYRARVLDRQAEPGQVVTATCQPPTLLVLGHADTLVARASLGPEAAGRLRLGDKVGVRLGPQTHAAEISALRSMPDGHFQVEATLARPEAALAGMAATLRLP